MPITELPTPPSSTDPANFAVRTDAFLAALPLLQSEMNSAIAGVSGFASAASGSAGAAAGSAGSASSSAGAASGSASAAAGSAVTASNAATVALSSPWISGTYQTVAGTSVTAVSGNHYILTNVAATTVTLPAAPAEGAVVWITAINGLTTNVAARNGRTIMSLSEDLTLDGTNQTVALRYVSTSWRILI